MTPLLTATPSSPPTYNPSMADTFSWIPVEGAGRPLFARATYLANPEDISITLSAGNINVNLDEIELNTDNLEEYIQETNVVLSAIQFDLNAEFDETQILLDALTALQTEKQDELITLLNKLTSQTDEIDSNTDNVETLLTESNYNLSALNSNITFELDQTQTLLHSLTAIQENKQDQIITLVDQLTSNTDSIEFLVTNSNTRLDVLTAVDYATGAKQDSIITLLDSLTSNTDNLGSLLQTSNTLLDAISSKELTISLDVSAINLNTDEIEGLIGTSNTLLDSLTAIQENKQDQIITLLHAITGSALQVDLNTDQLELHVDGVETLLNDLTASNKYVPGWSIPPYDEISFEYVGSTDIFRKVTYLNNSTQVMALSFVYVTEPPTTGNAIIQTVKKI